MSLPPCGRLAQDIGEDLQCTAKGGIWIPKARVCVCVRARARKRAIVRVLA